MFKKSRLNVNMLFASVNKFVFLKIMSVDTGNNLVEHLFLKHLIKEHGVSLMHKSKIMIMPLKTIYHAYKFLQ